jgi:cytochrome d ubiquinol oxidase subunit I
MKKREEEFARKSIKISAIFGLISLIILIWSGDGSAVHVAKKQPMKLAAMEGLYKSHEGTAIVALGILNPGKQIKDYYDNPLKYKNEKPFWVNISIPQGLSLLVNRKMDTYVPGVEDILEGGYIYTDRNGNEKVAPPIEERMALGKLAIDGLAQYRKAKQAGDEEGKEIAYKQLMDNFDHFGYGYIEKPTDVVPNVPLTFYAFHIMVILGGFFLLFFGLTLYMEYKGIIGKHKWFHWVAIASIPLVYICSQAGWIVAEVGRQPWTIQDLLPVNAAVSGVSAGSVQTTLIMFFVLFTILLIAEIGIMIKVIKKGPGA